MVANMLEESASFFIAYNFTWVVYWQLFLMTMGLLFGPFIMAFYVFKVFRWT